MKRNKDIKFEKYKINAKNYHIMITSDYIGFSHQKSLLLIGINRASREIMSKTRMFYFFLIDM